MNTSGEVADLMVKEGLQITEEVVKLTGLGAKNLAAIIIALLKEDNKLQGASAVIEKDLAAGKLAELLDADMLVILTSVDKVCLNFGTDEEKALDTLSVADAKKYLEAGEFEEGTMAPKIEAAIEFIGESAIKSGLITKLNKEGTEISGGMGTLIKK